MYTNPNVHLYAAGSAPHASRHTYQDVTSRTESCHACEIGATSSMSYNEIIHVNHVTCERVMPHMNEFCHV